MKSPLLKVYLLLPAFSALWGCSQPLPSERDACSFLHKEDVESVTKEEFDSGKRAVVDEGDGSRTTSCTFTSNRLSTPVALFHRTNGKDPQGSLRRFMQKAQKGKEIEVLNDLGDGAVWDRGVGQLTMFAGPDMFIYSVLVTQNFEEAKRISIELAQRVLQRSQR